MFSVCVEGDEDNAVFKKRDPNSASNYRPIALVPIFSKIVEKLIIEQLSEYLEVDKMINDTQFGYRRGYGPVNAIIRLVEDITLAFEKKETLIASFCDLSSAFDLVPHRKLLELLKGYGYGST